MIDRTGNGAGIGAGWGGLNMISMSISVYHGGLTTLLVSA